MKQQEQAPTLELGRTGMSAAACAVQSGYSSGCRSMKSAMSSDESSEMFTEVRCWSVWSMLLREQSSSSPCTCFTFLHALRVS